MLLVPPPGGTGVSGLFSGCPYFSVYFALFSVSAAPFVPSLR